MNVIQIENVGKRYWLHHRQPERRLMEVLHDAGRNLIRGFRQTAQPSPTNEEFWALKDISLSIAGGEVVGLIGRNGAGKSTLLKLISRIMAPTTGRIGVRGRLGCLLEVASGFHPELTGRENIFLNGAILGMSLKEIRCKFDAIVEFSEVEAFLDTPVKHYSSGMFVRLAFSVAAMLEPEVLIVDEVLSVGDAAFQKKSLAAIRQSVGNGATCLIVSHHLASLANLCQRAILLEAGQVVADGNPDDVIRQYLTTARRDGGEVVWSDRSQAPGNEEVRMASVTLRQPDQPLPVADLDVGHETSVIIEYDRLFPGDELCTTLVLKDHVGATVLMSTSARPMSAESSTSPQTAGRYRAACVIPANLLNEGRYAVTIRIGRGLNQPFAVAHDCLSFHVHDTSEQRGLFAGVWPGVVRPQLPWRLERVDS